MQLTIHWYRHRYNTFVPTNPLISLTRKVTCNSFTAPSADHHVFNNQSCPYYAPTQLVGPGRLKYYNLVTKPDLIYEPKFQSREGRLLILRLEPALNRLKHHQTTTGHIQSN